MFHNSSQEPGVSYSVVPAKVKFIAMENPMAFGFELKLYRLFQKYFLVGVTKVFPPKSVSCSKPVNKSEDFKSFWFSKQERF